MRGFSKSIAIASFAAILGAGASVSVANDSPLPAGPGRSAGGLGPDTTLISGDTYQGWTITFPQGLGVELAQDATTNQLVLVLEKFATFTSVSGLNVTFSQNVNWTGTPLATSIEVENESITNSSGSNWSRFDFELQTPFTGPNNVAASFVSGNEFVPPSGSNGSWSTVSFSSNDIFYTGSQASGTVSLWGQTQTTGDDLLIETNPSDGPVPQSFTFKELPTAGASVPLPAAAWSGLTGLLGLALIAVGKRFKKSLA